MSKKKKAKASKKPAKKTEKKKEGWFARHFGEH